MRHVPVYILLALTALAAGCSKNLVIEQVDPFVTPKAVLRSTVKVIALAEVAVPDGMQDPKPVQEQFDSLIEAELRTAGFSVVRPQEYEAAWREAVASVGGLADPDSGNRDKGKVTKAMFTTMERLRAEFKLDAVLIPAIVVVEAPFASGRAFWDGTTQSIKTGNIVKGFLAGSPEGKMGALSLDVTIHSQDGEVMYEAAGGIEVLSKLDGNDFVLVPPPELLTDAKKLRRAAAIALDPLSR